MNSTQVKFANVRKLAALISKDTWEAIKAENKEWSENEYDHFARISFKIGGKKVFDHIVTITMGTENESHLSVEWLKISKRKCSGRKYGFNGRVKIEELDSTMRQIMESAF